MDPSKGGDYGYCGADASALTGQFYAKCLSCIHSFTDQVYVTNGLVALEAGCLQRPAPGKTVGLNASIFSLDPISIVDPLTIANNGGSGSGSNTPTTIIAVASISSVIAVAAIAAIIFVCVRKRRNRRARATGGGGGAGGRGHRPKSSLSFRCQTHLSPMSPKFFGGDDGPPPRPGSGLGPAHSHQHLQFHQGGDSMYMPDDGGRRHIMTSPLRTTAGATPWRPASSIATATSPMSSSPVAAAVAERKIGGGGNEPLSEKQQMALSEKQLHLHQLTTALPTMPRTAHTSSSPGGGGGGVIGGGGGGGNSRSSPMTATPTSATQLLPSSSSSPPLPSGRLSTIAPYVPADYAGVSPGGGGDGGGGVSGGVSIGRQHLYSNHAVAQSPVSPIIRQQTGSPQLAAHHNHNNHHQWGWAVSTNGVTTTTTGGSAPPPPPKSPRMSGHGGLVFSPSSGHSSSGGGGGGGIMRKGMMMASTAAATTTATRESGSPTETVAIQTSFPGPPRR